MKKLLVLGATGFIGRNIAEYFAEQSDYEVHGTYFNSPPFKSPSISMTRADLTNQKNVNSVMKGMDYVVQAAAVTAGIKDVVSNPHRYIADNAIINSMVLRAAHELSVQHLIHLSCTVMYHSSDSALKETDYDANKEVYPNYFGPAWTKVYIEKMCEFYARSGRGKYTALRHSNVYGPYDKYDLEKSHVFGATINKVMESGNDENIVVWGSGEEGRDLLHVSDLVQCVEKVFSEQESSYELFNVGSGISTTIRDLVQKVIESSGKSLAIQYDTSKPSNKTTVTLDCSKARRLLGWKPRISIDEGIKLSIEWYKKYS